MNFEQSISYEIFKTKYMINGEKDPDEVFIGIAKEIASVEKPENRERVEKEFLNILLSGKLMPGGRIMANARPDSKMKYYNNCYTIDVEDSIDGIYNSLKEDAMISKTGGGVGFNISKVRPKDDYLSKGGKSSGVVSFLKVFNESAKIIQTGGSRRAAHICILNVDHPDIEEFITAKHGDTNGVLTQFNISVGITDKFIKAVDEDQDWELSFKGRVYKTLRAKELYELMVKNAFTHNEPGIMNMDIVEKYNNGWWAFKVDRSNPCQPSWAKVLTPEGIKEFKDISIGSTIWSETGWTTVVNKWKTGVKKVYKYETSRGVFFGTENHRVVSNGNKVEAKDAETIQTLRGPTASSITLDNQDIVDGLVFGDGSVHKASNNLVHLYIGENDESYFTSEIKDLIGRQRLGLKASGIAYEVTTTITAAELPKTFERRVPERFITNKNRLIGFLRGLYSANGSVVNNRVTLKSTSKGMVEDVQLMLSSIGITSYVTTNKPTSVKFSNGEYLCKQSYDVNISVDREKFVNLIGFIQPYKNEKIRVLESSQDRNMDSEIREISFVSEEEVWDITVDNDTHTYWTQGVNVSNCGEIVMPSYSLCCLASNNLIHFVKNPFEDNAFFDFEEYKKAIKTSVRFLDNVLDATKYPLERIETFSKEWRRIGLGFTGLGNALTMLRMKYGSPESLEICEQLAKTMRDESYRASIELAKEKGKFPAYDKRYEEGSFVKALPEDIQQAIASYGVRNIGLNTVAPNGTISLTIGQNCSSGIEPTFSLQYDRNIRTGRGDETKKETVYDYGWLRYLALAEEKGWSKERPDYFSTTLDIDPYASVDIQAVWQKYIDHSISKTANLPMNYSFEQYKDLFRYAYTKGLKGFTSFNPMGSMKGILEHSSETEKEAGEESKPVEFIERREAPKRPQDLPCDIEVVKVKDEKFLILVGLLNGTAYEVFCTNLTSDHTIDLDSHKEGIIRKNGKGDYNLIIKNGEERIAVNNIGKTFNKEYEGMSRLVSTSLRHGVPLEFIVDQLNKDAPFGGFRKGMSRVIKKFIKDGEVVKNGKKCPECGSAMIYKEGCVTCPSCGWSAC